MTPTQIAASYPPEVIEAYEWIKIHCQHWATLHNDWQTLDGLSEEKLKKANEHMELLTQLGMVTFAHRVPKAKPGRCGKPNFQLVPLTPQGI